MESLVQARGKEMLPLRDTREEGLMIVCVHLAITSDCRRKDFQFQLRNTTCEPI